jgi:triacylglycerol lipase
MTPDLRTKLDALGRELTPELLGGTVKLFSGLFEGMDPQTVEEIDFEYGPDPRHRLDVFREQNLDNAPVLVFVHGGGFIMGDKRNDASAFYRNVGDFAARHGFVGVVPTYRLAPDHPWPAGAEDVGRVMSWIKRHIEDFGGDPGKIVLSGQSAGAVHVASYIAHSQFHVEPGGGVAGAMLMSGLYDTVAVTPNDNHYAYYGRDAATFEEANCMPGLLATDVPLCFTVSEFDPAQFQREAARTVGAWGDAKGSFPEMHYLTGHNHLTPSQSLGTPVKEVEELLAGFVRRVTGQAAVMKP